MKAIHVLSCVSLVAGLTLWAFPAGALTKVACVGERLTNSAHRDDNAEYTHFLAMRLGAEFEVKNFGAPKSVVLKAPSTSYWKGKELPASLAYQPDVVVMMWGNNELATAWSLKGQFVSDYKALIAKYSELPKPPRVYIALTLPRGGKAGGPTETEVLPATRMVAADLGLPIIDAYTPFVGRTDEFLDADHPNPKGIRHLADVIYQAMTDAPAPDAGAAGARPGDAAGASVTKRLDAGAGSTSTDAPALPAPLDATAAMNGATEGDAKGATGSQLGPNNEGPNDAAADRKIGGGCMVARGAPGGGILLMLLGAVRLFARQRSCSHR